MRKKSCHRIDNIPSVVRCVTRDMRDASLPVLNCMSALVSGLFNIQAHICLILIIFHTEMKRAHVPKASLVFLFYPFSEYIHWSQKRDFSLQNLPEVKPSALFTQDRAKGCGTLSWKAEILERCWEWWWIICCLWICSSKLWLWHSLNVRQECYQEGRVESPYSGLKRPPLMSCVQLWRASKRILQI